LPDPLRQLSLLVVEPLARAAPATATVANIKAILVNFIILLSLNISIKNYKWLSYGLVLRGVLLLVRQQSLRLQLLEQQLEPVPVLVPLLLQQSRHHSLEQP
jgi:hypothetical protein